MGTRVKEEGKDAHTVVNVSLDVGDWLDVMDAEGTWNVAQVLSFPSPKLVEVKYDGWGLEFNEVVPLNSERVAPYHTYTWSVKCWAKYKNWPWWPSIVTIRSPGTNGGQTYLEHEDRLFVDFLDRKDITKRCRCWIERSKVTPFDERYDERRKRTTGSDFEASLAMALKSTASSKFPSFATGTLPVEFNSSNAISVKAMKKQLGMKQWAGFFNTNRSRHRGVYMYKSPDGADFVDDDDPDDDEENFVVEFTELSDNEDDASKKSRAKGKGKVPERAKVGKSPKSVKSGKLPTPGKLAKSGKSPKSGKLPTARKSSASKYGTEVLDPVVLMQDSARIFDGPHAPSQPKESEEKPMYLPPLDDPVDDSSLKSGGPSNTGREVYRKRKSVESTEPSSLTGAEAPSPKGKSRRRVGMSMT